jgi:hypothetical protein
MAQYFGKYEGTVDENFDPLGQGRLLVKVPAVFHEGKNWALPCVPYAGPDVGFFMMPPKDAHIWVEFAGGDFNRPIWTGCYWGDGESAPVSISPLAASKKMIKTDNYTVTLDDTPGLGGITIETSDGLKIVMDMQGIEINNGLGGSIKLNGPKVAINGTALEVV